MQRRERVWAAINHQETDLIPKGEIFIAQSLIDQLLPLKEQNRLERKKQFLEKLGLDLVVVPVSREDREEKREEIVWWSKETDFFVFFLVNGGFQETCFSWGFEETLLATLSRPQELAGMIEEYNKNNLQLGLELLKAGGHGVIIGEDIAYKKGTLISPTSLRELVFPSLGKMVQEFKRLGFPVFLHSDGNLEKVLEDIVNLGFDGLQGLESGAGMDLRLIKEKYGDRLCLMGNIDLEVLGEELDKEKIASLVEMTVKQGQPGGGYIFGTSGGLGEDLFLVNIKYLYRLAADY